MIVYYCKHKDLASAIWDFNIGRNENLTRPQA